MEKFIISMDDLAMLHDDLVVLMSRLMVCILRAYLIIVFN